MRYLWFLAGGVSIVVACGGGSTTNGDAGLDGRAGGAAGQGGSHGGGGASGAGGSGGASGVGGASGIGSGGSSGSGAGGSSGTGSSGSGSGGGSGSAGASGSGSGGGSGSAGASGGAGASGSAGAAGSSGGGGAAGAPADSGSETGGADTGLGADASVCAPPHTTCTKPCPGGTYCLVQNGPLVFDLGCTTIPPSCGGVPTCGCMAECFCTGASSTCKPESGFLECDTPAVSRREFKKDITYVTSEERAELAEEALSTPLARYHYTAEPDAQKKHLGFIIDDQPVSSPAVASDETHIDQYGYTSMLLAAVQEQQKQIEALKKEVAALKNRPAR